MVHLYLGGGYVYDTETTLYYLQSRYYDPAIGRFINADSYASTGQGVLGNNMFAYCNNSPTNLVDSSGTIAIAACAIVIGASGIIGALTGAFSAVATGGNAIEGAIEGMFLGAAGASCGLFLQGFAAFAAGAICGGVIDVVAQSAVQYDAAGSVDAIQFDYVRLAKSVFTTGLGTLIPPWGKAADDIIAALGTAVMWGEASTLIACTDVVTTNISNSSKWSGSVTPNTATSTKKSQSAYEKMNMNKKLIILERRLAF